MTAFISLWRRVRGRVNGPRGKYNEHARFHCGLNVYISTQASFVGIVTLKRLVRWDRSSGQATLVTYTSVAGLTSQAGVSLKAV